MADRGRHRDRDRNRGRDRDRDRDSDRDRAQRELDGTVARAGRALKVPTSREGVAVIGLGRFGGQVASSLVRLGHEVLGVDQDRDVVQNWADLITHAAQADGTNNTALQQLGVSEFQRVVVGIGTELEASVLTVLSLVEVGVPEIWARAVSRKHGKILASVGAAHVIYPEAAMGDRVAHLITTKMLDFTELDEGFALAKTCLPKDLAGRTTAEGDLSRRYGVRVIGIRTSGKTFEYAPPDAPIPPGATIIVAGPTIQVQRFAAAT